MNKKIILLIATLAAIILEVIFSFFTDSKNLDSKTFIETIAAIVALIGIFTETKKQRQRNKTRTHAERKFSLNNSFENGVYGGLIGGIISGCVISFIFYTQQSQLYWKICLQIPSYCAMIGCLFGGLISIGRSAFASIVSLQTIWADFWGSFFACIVAGALSGMLGMWLFGDNHFPFIGYDCIVIASIVGALGLLFGAIIYDYEGKIKYVITSMAIALFLSIFISMFGYMIIDSDSHFSNYLLNKIYSPVRGYLIEAGMWLGLINGTVFGLTIGLTLMFYNLKKFSDKQSILNSHSINKNV